MFFREYIYHNWPLLLVLAALIVSLKTTVFVDRVTIRRNVVLIVTLFLLSLSVFVESWLTGRGEMRNLLIFLAGIRYSVTPFIIALIILTLTGQTGWWKIYIPAIINAGINLLSLFNGIVFTYREDASLQRGPLGYLPFIMVGLYCAALVVILFRRSRRQKAETIQTVFFGCIFAVSLFLPFVYGRAYLEIFCPTIAIMLYVYHVFTVYEMTKKDVLTGLLNRQAYYADINRNPEGISAIISIDMNGLKAINDARGHKAGDEALSALGACFLRTLNYRYPAYRVGGDEFIVVCRDITREEAEQLVEDLRKNIAETGYACAVGYSVAEEGGGWSADDLVREADAMMYAKKREYYISSGHDRRRR